MKTLKTGAVHSITGKMYIYKVEPSFWDFFEKEGSRD
jgi:hypothetical protein